MRQSFFFVSESSRVRVWGGRRRVLKQQKEEGERLADGPGLELPRVLLSTS